MPCRYQKNTGRRQCIFLLLLIIFGLIVVLIFKPRRHHSASAPEPGPASSTLPSSASAGSDGLVETQTMTTGPGARSVDVDAVMLDTTLAAASTPTLAPRMRRARRGTRGRGKEVYVYR